MSNLTHHASTQQAADDVRSDGGQAARIQLPDPSRIKVKTPDQWTLMRTEQ
jgi:hypothetical protein